MRVLLLTPLPHYLADAITTAGDHYDVSMEPPERWTGEFDFAVSFGYRHILSERYINALRGRLINIHISLLPWNRGADPNFWSWFDRTPKGITIHAIDAGIDTGDVLAQCEASFLPPKETLRSSYSYLVNLASNFFSEQWPILREYDWDPILIPSGGSYHRSGDKDRWMNKLTRGWDTPVAEVEELGAASRDN